MERTDIQVLSSSAWSRSRRFESDLESWAEPNVAIASVDVVLPAEGPDAGGKSW